jgi:hypothetical protein
MSRLSLKAYAPFFLLVVGLAGLALVVSSRCSGDSTSVVVPTPTAFSPVTLNGLRILNEEPIHPGTIIQVKNGYCNDSDETYAGTVLIQLQEDLDRTATEPVIIFDNLVIPIDPGCHGDDPLDIIVPNDIKLGQWEIFARVVITGETVDEVQRENEVSEIFPIVAR